MSSTTQSGPVADLVLDAAARDIFVDGEWVRGAASELLDIDDSHSEERIGQVRAGSAEDVARSVASAGRAFDSWSRTTVEERARHLRQLADALGRQAELMANIITRETGTPIEASRGYQVEFALDQLRQFAELLPEVVFTRRVGSSIVNDIPLGVAGAIVPWNMPLAAATLKIGAALAAGCTVVLKPSEVAPLSAVYLGEAIRSSGLPPGVLNIVFGTGAVVGEALVSHPGVACVTFTGSTRAGKRISELAASAVKPLSLELGGKSALVVLDDADVVAAANHALESSMLVFNGQACDALTRIVVPRGRGAEVENVLSARAATLKIGDPTDPDTELGPLVSRVQKQRFESLLSDAIHDGARVVCGGPGTPAGVERGYYVRPTVLSCDSSRALAAQVEFFGPALTVLEYDDEEDALRIANDSEYGLGGGVWSADPERAVDFARRMRTGQVHVNVAEYNMLAPYGGFKMSGHGREQGEYGIREFLAEQAIQL